MTESLLFVSLLFVAYIHESPKVGGEKNRKYDATTVLERADDAILGK